MMILIVDNRLLFSNAGHAPARRTYRLSIALAISILAHVFLLQTLVSSHTSDQLTPVHWIGIELLPKSGQSVVAETSLEEAEQSNDFPMPFPIEPLSVPKQHTALEPGDQRSPAPSLALPVVSGGLAVKSAEADSAGSATNEPDSMPIASSQSADEIADEDSWKQRVRLDLMNWLQQHKRYPLAARRNGVQGSVMVRFVVSAEGLLLEKEMLESSGSKHLDSAAMKLLSRAAPYPRFPARLLAEVLEVRLPIEYRLLEQRHRT